MAFLSFFQFSWMWIVNVSVLKVFSSCTTEEKRYIHFLPSRQAIRANILYTFVTGFSMWCFRTTICYTCQHGLFDHRSDAGIQSRDSNSSTWNISNFLFRIHICNNFIITFNWGTITSHKPTHPVSPPLTVSPTLSPPFISLVPYLLPMLSAALRVALDNMLTAVC